MMVWDDDKGQEPEGNPWAQQLPSKKKRKLPGRLAYVAALLVLTYLLFVHGAAV